MVRSCYRTFLGVPTNVPVVSERIEVILNQSNFCYLSNSILISVSFLFKFSIDFIGALLQTYDGI